MTCADGALLGRLKALVRDIEGGNCCCPPSSNQVCQPIPPTTEPCATCCMVCPPPILAPTSPSPVKPLRLPCPTNENQQPPMSEEEAERTRYANFYNNYNVDWHAGGSDEGRDCADAGRRERCAGVTTDGKSPCCEEYSAQRRKRRNAADRGCPTGFKPCSMKLTPPAGCHPCGVWAAEVQPCPPKTKKSKKYEPGPCTRPCCKHWKSKDGECKYDDPCKAQCFNHPPGMKPTKHPV